MEKTLEDLKSIRSVKGSILVSNDGLVLASAGDFDNDVDFIGASIGEIFLDSSTIMNEKFNSGNVSKLIIESERNFCIIYKVSEDAMLVVVAEKDANLGIINIESKSAAEKLYEILS